MRETEYNVARSLFALDQLTCIDQTTLALDLVGSTSFFYQNLDTGVASTPLLVSVLFCLQPATIAPTTFLLADGCSCSCISPYWRTASRKWCKHWCGSAMWVSRGKFVWSSVIFWSTFRCFHIQRAALFSGYLPWRCLNVAFIVSTSHVAVWLFLLSVDSDIWCWRQRVVNCFTIQFVFDKSSASEWSAKRPSSASQLWYFPFRSSFQLTLLVLLNNSFFC